MKKIIKKHRYLWRRYSAYRLLAILVPPMTVLSVYDIVANGFLFSLILLLIETGLSVSLLFEQMKTRSMKYSFLSTLHQFMTFRFHHDAYVDITTKVEECYIASKNKMRDDIMQLRMENHNLTEQIAMLQAK